jgi:hypothetical protein
MNGPRRAPDPGRRAVLLGGCAAVGSAVLGGWALAGCSGSSSAAGALASTAASASTGAPPATAAASASGAAKATVALPTTRPWTPTAAEVSPAVKVGAVRLLEAVGAWPPGHGGLAAARTRAARLGYDPRLADQAAALLPSADAAAVQVVDVQYGGILSSSSSVLVVLRQWTLHGTTLAAGGTTVDVRLVAASPRWRVTALYPARPHGPAAPLPAASAELMAQSRLHLPVAARADIRSGTISAGTMRALAQLAREHVVDVSVVKSGHPLYVFGTNRLSDHPRGHAFDVWAIDGRTVLDPANRALTERFMRRGIALGAWQVGGPVDLDGGGSLYFSDNTHHDHVHMGFRD